MQAARKQLSKQQETIGVVLVALVFVLAYTAWGASILRAERQASTQGPSLVLNS